MAPVRIVLVGALALGALWLLDRLARGAEARGWIYWRKVKPKGNALGAVTLELQNIFESGRARHVQEAPEQAERATPDPGGDRPGARPPGSVTPGRR